MKNFSLLQIAGLLSVVIAVASCGFTQPIYDEDYADRGSRRQIYNDPYYGNNNRTTIVRDPYTGQYYEVTPVGPNTYYPGAAYGYGYPTGRTVYSQRNQRSGNGDRTYRNSNSNTYNRNSTGASQDSRPQQQPASNSGSRKIDDTKSIINGTAN
jgi:hypothetical protein